jgi:hypothetical protein
VSLDFENPITNEAMAKVCIGQISALKKGEVLVEIFENTVTQI